MDFASRLKYMKYEILLLGLLSETSFEIYPLSLTRFEKRSILFEILGFLEEWEIDLSRVGIPAYAVNSLDNSVMTLFGPGDGSSTISRLSR